MPRKRLQTVSTSEDWRRVREVEHQDELILLLEEGVHPGVVLYRMLELRKLKGSELSDRIDLSRPMISAIINDRRRITASTAKKLAEFFHMPVGKWIEAQARIDIEKIEQRSAKDPLAA